MGPRRGANPTTPRSSTSTAVATRCVHPARTAVGLPARAHTGLPVFSSTTGWPAAPVPRRRRRCRARLRLAHRRRLAADQIVVAGDSAGGHLALDLTLRYCAPAALARRPGAALAARRPDAWPGREREQVREDPMISAAGVRRLIAHYTGGRPEHARLAHYRRRGGAAANADPGRWRRDARCRRAPHPRPAGRDRYAVTARGLAGPDACIPGGAPAGPGSRRRPAAGGGVPRPSRHAAVPRPSPRGYKA